MITIKIGGSVVDNLHPSTIADIKKIVESEGVILVHAAGVGGEGAQVLVWFSKPSW